jgi:hypothetical protein
VSTHTMSAKDRARLRKGTRVRAVGGLLGPQETHPSGFALVADTLVVVRLVPDSALPVQLRAKPSGRTYYAEPRQLRRVRQ